MLILYATAIQSLTIYFLSLYNNEERVTVKSGISLQRLMPIFLFFYGKDVNVLISYYDIRRIVCLDFLKKT